MIIFDPDGTAERHDRASFPYPRGLSSETEKVTIIAYC